MTRKYNKLQANCTNTNRKQQDSKTLIRNCEKNVRKQQAIQEDYKKTMGTTRALKQIIKTNNRQASQA